MSAGILNMRSSLSSMIVVVLLVSFTSPSSCNDPSEWSGWGGSILNDRYSRSTAISSSNIKSLSPKCKLMYDWGVSAAPTLCGNTAYYPTWNGSFVALDYTTCTVRWSINVTQIIYDNAPPVIKVSVYAPVSRTSPQVAGDVLFFGTAASALIVAVDITNGDVLSVEQLSPHPAALITMSPTFYNDVLFVGASSVEEELPLYFPGYECCSFAGIMAAFQFDRSSTKMSLLWNMSTIPDDLVASGWSGAAVWGSQPSIDTVRNQVFIATGNTYSIPDVIADCRKATQNITAVKLGLVPEPCLPTEVWQNSVLAIDISSGVVNWVRGLGALDVWNGGCFVSNAAICPKMPGPDADFGMEPTFVKGGVNTPYNRDTLVIGQKNGNIHALSAESGTIFWTTATSPDGVQGGLSWGIAVDEERAYFTAANSLFKTWILQPSNITTNYSAYGAASLKDGTILWEVAPPGINSLAYGSPTVVGDLVLVERTGTYLAGPEAYRTKGSLLALNKATGKLVYQKVLDANARGGIAVSGEWVLFGSGYRQLSSYDNTTGSFWVAKVF